MMWLLTIALTALLLLIAWAAGGVLYQIQTDNLIREASRLRHYNVMGRTTPERAESDKDDGNKVHEQRQQEGKRISGSGRRCGVL